MMFHNLDPQALALSFDLWIKQQAQLPACINPDSLGNLLPTETYRRLYCSLPSAGIRSSLSDSAKIACFVNMMMAALGFVSVTPFYFRCNDGFVDSFCEAHHSRAPMIEHIRLLETTYISDDYILRKVYNRLAYTGPEDIAGNLKQLLTTIQYGMSTCGPGEYELYQFSLDLLEDIQENRFATGPKPWDPEAWLNGFLPAWNARDRREQHDIRAAYYRKHMALVKQGSYQTQSGKTVQIPNDPVLAMNSTKIYRQELRPAPSEGKVKTRYAVFNEDCLVVAKQLQQEHPGKTAVLNLANRQTPGGGVYTGSGAQEESCFLRSNYFLFLYPYASFAAVHGLPEGPVSYPMDRDFGGTYCEGVTVFRGTELEGYPLFEEPWQTNFIAVAALNRPELHYNGAGEARISERLVPAALNKIRTVFNIAIDNRIENLVLGAMGCGAFRNPPRHIAALFAQVLREPPYRNRFANIVFAIKGDDNFLPFQEMFGNSDAE